MHSISRGVDAFTNWLMVIAAILAACISLFVFFDIFAHNAGVVFYGAPDYIKNIIVAIVFLWLPYCVKADTMLRMDFLVAALSEGPRRAFIMFGHVLGVLFFAAIAYGALEPTYNSWLTNEVEDRGMGITVPVWPARAAILFGCIAATLIYILRIVEVALGINAGPSAAARSEPGV
ncbi:MAG: TRAP transporter small permease [Alphaproteobacteria bacterium]|nr:TRAP transporter small permease [Alphaproteobacteria bacterium]